MVDIDGTLELLGAELVHTDTEVGSFISSVFNLIWPQNGESDEYFVKVTEKVYRAIAECIEQEKVDKLRNLIEETRTFCHEYIDTDFEDEDRKQRCLELHEVLNQLKPYFMDMSYESVVYFVQFAVLHISVNVDMVVLFKSGHVALDEKNKQNLKDLINEYSVYVHKMSIKLVEFRLSQIGTVCTCRLDPTDPLVVRHQKLRRSGVGYDTSFIITSYGVAKDHKTGQDLVFSAFSKGTTHSYGEVEHKEIKHGKEKCRQELREYRERVQRETEEYWKQNIVDPIDVLKDAKVLEPLNCELLTSRKLMEKYKSVFVPVEYTC